MKLMKLSIRNFKGIESLELDLGGRDAVIYGDNATGKTSIFDAFQWLLFGKDSQGRSDFEIKPLGADGKVKQNGLDVVVKATLEHDGRRIELEKTLSENWARPRGSRQPVFTGHSTGCAVDGLPMRQKEYQQFIEGLIPEKRFRLLTNPCYFSAILPWKERREILFEIAGEVTEAEVLASDAAFAPLAEALQGHSVEELRRILASQIKKTNAELAALPVRIDETSRTLTEAVDARAARAMAEGLQLQRRALEGQLLQPDTARLEAEAAKVEAEMARIRSETLEEAAQARADWERDRRAREEAIRAELDSMESAPDDSASLAGQLLQLESELARCREEQGRVRGTKPPVETVCPTCGRPYDNREALAAAMEAFEREKRETLSRLSAREAQLTGETKPLKTQLEASRARARAMQAAREGVRQRLAAVRAEVYTPPAMDRSQTEGLAAQLEALRAQMQAQHDGVRQSNLGLYSRIASLDEQIRAAMADAARQEQNERAAARRDELMDEQQSLTAEMERLEQLRYLAEAFTRAKVQLLQERVDSAFLFARFRLFDEQVNGGLADGCEVMVDGVPFRDLNHAMQINVGLDVIRTLGMRYGVTAPVVVDNAESVTALEPMNCQVIRLVVSGGDRALRVETAREAR